jgi:multiple sugar transport system permease protein
VTGEGGRRQQPLLLAPAAALLGAVVALPLARVVRLCFTQVELEGGLATRPAGLATLGRLLGDERFRAAVRNTAVFTGASVALETLLGLALALLLNRRFAGRSLARAAVLVPWALPTAVTALAWSWIFNDTFGVANDLLRRLHLLAQPVAWLAEPATAMAALVVADAWKTTPFVALVLLAGLQSIPEDVLEAAAVDGLSPARRFFSVVLPLLAPSLVAAIVFRAVQAYGAFDVVYVMTGGGPGGSTETVSLYAFQNDFRYLDFGYGSAVAVTGMLAATAGAAAALRLTRGAVR